MIKNLIFDFGKVLVDYDFEAFFRKQIPDADRCKAFTPLLYNEKIQQLLDREAKPFNEIMEEIIEQHPSFESEIRMFNEHYTEIVTEEIDGMRELLTQLKLEGYKLYGLTNLRYLSCSMDMLFPPKRRLLNPNLRYTKGSLLNSTSVQKSVSSQTTRRKTLLEANDWE